MNKKKDIKNINNDKYNYYTKINSLNIINEFQNSMGVNFDKDEEIKKSLKKQNFNWLNYFYYMICCYRNNPIYQLYEKFRAKIISEEILIQDHLYVYKLIKAFNIDNLSNPFQTFYSK